MFIKRPVISMVLLLVILISGIYSTLKVPVLQFPKIESSNLKISTLYPGASADTVQGFITDPIEQVAMTVPGIDYVDSTTTAGLSTVTLWMNLNENSSEALAELTSRLNQIKAELPTAAMDPTIEVQRADQSYALFYLGIESQGMQKSAVTDYLKRSVVPLLSSIEGVQRVGVEGGHDPAMRVWIEPTRLAAMDLGPDDVFRALTANNVVSAIGRTEDQELQINLTTNSNLKTVQEFKRLVLAKRADTLIRLGDVARVELGEDRGDNIVAMDKTQTVFLSVWSLPGANAIAIGDELYKRLEKINPTLPQGMTIKVASDSTAYMRDALREIVATLTQTFVIVCVVIVLLMGSFRTAFVPLIAIPLSILGAIAIVYAVGFSLNLLTILAIVLCVGLVVDDAIVVVENVSRHMQEGKSRIEAALISSRELVSPIITMALTLIAVYLPIAFISGLTGALFKEFTLTLALAVLISAVVAITISPIMSAYVCADKGRETRFTRAVNQYFERLRAAYARLLDRIFLIKAQVLFVGLCLSLLLVPFYLFSAKELAPTEDQSSIQVVIQAPPDARVEFNAEQMKAVVDSAAKLPGYDNVWQVLMPSGGFAGIEFVDFAQREHSVHELRAMVSQTMTNIEGLRILPILPSALPTAGQFDVELVVQGPGSYAELEAYAGQLIGAAYQSGHFTYADTNLKINQSQVQLRLDHTRIADLGMNVQQVTEQLSILLAEQDYNRFDGDGKSYRVIPMVETKARNTPFSLLDLQIKTPASALIPVRAIASLEHKASPQALGKFNQQRAFRIFGGIHGGTTSEAALNALEKSAKEILPGNYTIDHAGISRSLRKEGNSMMGVLLISLLMVYLVLAVQFNGFRAPLVVLLGSVPLALSAALMCGFLGYTTLNIYAQVGLVTLVGLVAKNAILINQFANSLQADGLAKVEAIKLSAQLRLRPILMTTLSTVIGQLPLVLVTGPGAEARNSIGIILVAGMALGTLFTLFILPCVYLLLAKDENQKASNQCSAESIGEVAT